eukprot:CAMPEP_0172484410 /NCGR_PEP_ID=MMETSP1066-20121228/11879_1 /TAXON_ID=671091 /ORGANISM="Coscinodiscus wailesii, Strain CCMP2513" /LENGTH=87 /DNA_ID=CAMNT_0013248921 /DNA_START=255 /DNA_END=515 /DNA_ORIENTATION=+
MSPPLSMCKSFSKPIVFRVWAYLDCLTSIGDDDGVKAPWKSPLMLATPSSPSKRYFRNHYSHLTSMDHQTCPSSSTTKSAVRTTMQH